MAKDYTEELMLYSSFEEMDKLEPFVTQLKEQLSLSEEQYNQILLPLSEAVSNAIIHGNDQDPNKKVTVEAQCSGSTLEISVSDEGPGFDPLSLPEPLKEENLLNKSGRGVYLIKQYADEVIFSKGGAKITMRFTLDG
jgi:serine/threonine-protein kinase RsbW